MLFNIKTENYFLYNKNERDILLRQIANYYVHRFVQQENDQTFFTSVNELIGFFEREERASVEQQEYENAEIYLQLRRMMEEILDKLKEQYNV